MKIDVKKLIRNADYEPVSSDFDKQMMEMFNSALEHNPAPNPTHRKPITTFIIFANATVVAVILLFAVYLLRNTDHSHDRLAQAPKQQDSIISQEDIAYQTESIFDHQHVTLKNLYTAVSIDGELRFVERTEF